MKNELIEKQAGKLTERKLEQFSLFNSDIDKRTTDIFEISNPFETILPQLINQDIGLSKSQLINLRGTSIVNAMTTRNQIHSAFFDDSTGKIYKPDFDNLSPDVKNKLESGRYKLGDSKKIEGNLRAVIVDTQNHNTRVEDLTLKEVDEVIDSSSDLATQLQLKKIYELLLDIQSTQDYQIAWDRNNSILSPFFESRMKVIEAQSETNLEKKSRLLEQATDLMEKSISHIKSDILSNRTEILKKINQPTYLYQSFERHTNFILSDIQIFTKIVGMQMYMDLTLGKQEFARERFLAYQSTVMELSNQNIPLKRNLVLNLLKKAPKIKELGYMKKQDFASIFEIIHENYRPSKDNPDLWLDIDREVKNMTNENYMLNSGEEHLRIKGENNAG